MIARAATMLALTITLPSAAADAKQDSNWTRPQLEAVIHDYLMQHPEILPQMMTKLREKATSARIDKVRDSLFKPYAGAWSGAQDGDVVIVEFFDYACGHCRAMEPALDRLLKDDKGVKLVLRALPILGPPSDAAALQSLQAAEKGSFAAYHHSLFIADSPSPENRSKAAKAAGLGTDDSSTSAARNAEISANLAMARTLEISGTPAFVIGDQLLSGEVSYDALKTAVAVARTQK